MGRNDERTRRPCNCAAEDEEHGASAASDDDVLADTPVPYMPDMGMRRTDSSRQMQEMQRIAGGKFTREN